MNEIKKRWLTGCLFFFCMACRHQGATELPAPAPLPETLSAEALVKAKGQIDLAADSIQTGDMITRTGNDFTSLCLRQFCQLDDSYSHCGIASIEHDSVFVYHALGGEFNPDQKLLRESLTVFLAPEANRGFAIFRPLIRQDVRERLLVLTKGAFTSGIPFDMDFDLATDDRMYCSEFTGKMYSRAVGNDSLFKPSIIGDFTYYAPDNLFSHSIFHTIYRVVY